MGLLGDIMGGAGKLMGGPLGWTIAGLDVAKGVYDGVEANQTRQRNKGYINDAYRTASARMEQQQRYGAQGNAEALNARGLVSGSLSPIKAAMVNGSGTGATDLAGQSQGELLREYALDKHSLDSAHTQALNDNNATAMNGEIGGIAEGIGGIASGVQAGQEAGAIKNMNKTPIRSALLSGSSFDGVHPVDPLGDASSSWHMGAPGLSMPNGTSVGDGMSNSSFNVG